MAGCLAKIYIYIGGGGGGGLNFRDSPLNPIY